MNQLAIREYLNGASKRQQCFGQFDCVRFVTELLYVGWGKDYRAVLDYWDRRSAVRRLRKAGGLRNACCDALGNMTTDLEVGDIVYYEEPASIGLMMPGYVIIFVGNAIHRLDPSTALAGWKT